MSMNSSISRWISGICLALAILLTFLLGSSAHYSSPLDRSVQAAHVAVVDKEWTTQFGTDTRDQATGVSVSSQGVYVSGYICDSPPVCDGYVSKYNANGDEDWLIELDTDSTDGDHRVAVDSTGVYVAGATGLDLLDGNDPHNPIASRDACTDLSNGDG